MIAAFFIKFQSNQRDLGLAKWEFSKMNLLMISYI